MITTLVERTDKSLKRRAPPKGREADRIDARHILAGRCYLAAERSADTTRDSRQKKLSKKATSVDQPLARYERRLPSHHQRSL